MFNFQKDENKQHASNVFESFIRSVNAQFHITSDKYHTISTGYLFSPVPNVLQGWSIEVNKDNRVIVNTHRATLTNLNNVMRITPRNHKLLSPQKEGKATYEEKNAIKNKMKNLVSKSFDIKKADIAVTFINEYTHSFHLAIDITEFNTEKLKFISDMLSISDFMPKATSLSSYDL